MGYVHTVALDTFAGPNTLSVLMAQPRRSTTPSNRSLDLHMVLLVKNWIGQPDVEAWEIEELDEAEWVDEGMWVEAGEAAQAV
jgi:hypothetical protein